MEEYPLFNLIDLLLQHGPWGVLSIISVSFIFFWQRREDRIVRLLECEAEKTRDLIRLWGLDLSSVPRLSPSQFIPEGSDKPTPQLVESGGSGVGGSTSAAVPAMPVKVTRSYP